MQKNFLVKCYDKKYERLHLVFGKNQLGLDLFCPVYYPF